jgi:hypothetical protein
MKKKVVEKVSRLLGCQVPVAIFVVGCLVTKYFQVVNQPKEFHSATN